MNQPESPIIKNANNPVSLGRVAVNYRPGLALRLPQWIILDTENNPGPLIPTTDPTDVHHCTELPRVLPLHESLFAIVIIQQFGARGETRTRTDFSTATSRQRGYHYTTRAILAFPKLRFRPNQKFSKNVDSVIFGSS